MKTRRAWAMALALSQVVSCGLSVVAVNAIGLAAAHGGDAALGQGLVALACVLPCIGIGGGLWLRFQGHQPGRP